MQKKHLGAAWNDCRISELTGIQLKIELNTRGQTNFTPIPSGVLLITPPLDWVQQSYKLACYHSNDFRFRQYTSRNLGSMDQSDRVSDGRGFSSHASGLEVRSLLNEAEMLTPLLEQLSPTSSNTCSNSCTIFIPRGTYVFFRIHHIKHISFSQKKGPSGKNNATFRATRKQN